MKAMAFATALGVLAVTVAAAQDVAPRGAEPILRVDTGGPSSFVTALAFSPDNRTLYAGGWDKVVRAWSLNDKEFTPSPTAAFRVPLGPGQQGQINALAISPEGTWLAVAGVGHSPRVANFRESGWILSAAGKTEDIRLDEGTIYLFNRRTRAVHRLPRAHRGPVLALAFSSSSDQTPLLASAAEEWSHGEFKGVVRLWNVAERKHIGAKALKYKRVRPQLAVLQSKGDPKSARVAVAWYDGQLRIWDTRSNLVREQPDGFANSSVSLLNGSTILTSSSSRQGVGQLKFWKLAADATPQPDATRRQLQFERSVIPQALASITSGDAQAVDHVAVASFVFAANDDDKSRPTRVQLRLVSLQPPTYGETSTTDLWSFTGAPRLPTLVASGDGKYLAVSGGPSHEVLVYSISDLLNKKYQPQRLASQAVAMHDVAFAEKDGELGLLFRDGASQDDFNTVFPLSSGHLEPFQPAGTWKKTSDATGWQARRANGHMEVLQQGRMVGKVPLPPAVQVSDFAVAPPTLARDVPILALATHESGMPSLSLFNVETGEQVFQYTGHTERIFAVSFSPDARLLVSASADQTVRLWSLNDLAQVLDKRGQLLGVAVKKVDDPGLQVVSVEPNCAASEMLQVGDRLAGHVTGGMLRQWAGRYSFHEHWRTLKPGSELTVRRMRDNVTEDVPLLVGQAIEERKPLFSLLLTRGPQLVDWKWVGWNPLGPFESSDRRIERYLGWHFNTQNPAQPTAFAELDQYRDTYFRRGLLRDLARDGELLAAPPPPPLFRPAMSLQLTQVDDEHEKPQQQILIRRTLDSVQLALDYAFPTDGVGQMTLQVDGQPAGEFHREGDGTWRASLPEQVWRRGSHRLRATLRTNELTPQNFSEDIDFRFVPAAPQIRLRQSASRSTAKEQEALQAEVRAGSVDEPIDVEIHRLVGGQSTSTRRLKGDDLIKINGLVRLEMGVNEFEVVARNRQSDEATSAEETSRQRFVITRFKGPVSPPRIELSTLVPAADAQEKALRIPIHLGQTAEVTTSQVRVFGTIMSTEENLKLVERFAGKATTGRPLGKLVENKSKKYKINDKIQLVPGLQKLRYRGQTENSEPADVELAIEYRPPLPTVQITSPTPGQQVREFSQQPTILFEGRLLMPQDRQPFTISVHVNGERQKTPLKVNEDSGAFRTSVPLRFGDNQLKVEVSSEWHADPQVQVVDVAYRPAPRIASIDYPQQVESPFVNLTISGRSEAKINQVVFDERTLAADSYQVQTDPRNDKGFRVEIPKLPVQPGRESIALRLYSEGSPTPAVTEFSPPVVRKPTPPAEIVITDPTRNATVNQPSYAIHFRVTSQSQLRAVELWQDGTSVFRTKDAGELEPQGDLYRKQVTVNLQPGINHFEITAENEGGLQREALTINQLGRPVSLTVDGIAPLDAPNKLIEPLMGSIGSVRFAAPASSHTSLLRGKVVWNNPTDEKLRNKDQQLRVWVNGHQQLPKTLDPPSRGTLERRFEIPVVLSRSQGNVVEIGLPGMQREASSRFLLDVDCQSPLTKQRLHLLVVAVDASDRAAIVDRAVKAVQGKRTGPKDFTTALGVGFIYGPLTDPTLSTGTVNRQLRKINQTIRRLQDRELANDVVLVYYQGAMVNTGGKFFLTTQHTDDPTTKKRWHELDHLKQYSISDDTLSTCVEYSSGAWVLLLDVDDETPSRDARWPADSHAAMLRYAWSQDESAPVSARLIDVLDRVNPSSQRLGQLAAELELVGKAYDSGALRYEHYVPETLRQLRLRRAP